MIVFTKGPRKYELSTYKEEVENCCILVNFGKKDKDLFYIVKNFHGDERGHKRYGVFEISQIHLFTYPTTAKFDDVNWSK